MSFARWLFTAAVVSGSVAPARAAEPTLAERAAALLKSHCVSCHGSLKTASLDLRTRASVLAGGAHGAVVVPGRPEQSRLFRLVPGAEKLQMPPAQRDSRADGRARLQELSAADFG